MDCATACESVQNRLRENKEANLKSVGAGRK